MINLLHTKTFLAVVDETGFRNAARSLSLAPSTIVDHIHQLEATLGAPLLVRKRGSVHVTRQGAILLPLARALVATAEEMHRLIGGTSLRVAAASNVGTYLLPEPLSAFKRQAEASVDVWVGSNPDVRARLTRGLADIGLVEVWMPSDGFDAYPWREEPMVLIVSPEHRWAMRGVLDIDELAGEPMLGGERGTGTGALLRASLGRIYLRLTTVDGFGNTEAVKRGVRAGLGVSMVMRGAVADELHHGSLVAVPVRGLELVKHTQIVLPSGIPDGAMARRFLATLRDTAA